MSGATDAVRRFGGVRALIVGDAMLDAYYLGTATRLSPEGPVPVVRSCDRRFLPGGAANTAANVRSLGGRATLLAAVGADHEGEVLRRELLSRGVDVAPMIVDPDRPTTTKLRILADGHFLARCDEEEDRDLTGEVQWQLLEGFRALFRDSDVVIVSDYAKGVVTPAFVAELGSLNRAHDRLVVVDSKDLSRHSFQNVSVITPNHLDAQGYFASPVDAASRGHSANGLEALGRGLLERIGTRWVIVTMGADGALLFERGEPTVRVRAQRVRNPDAVGAGDTFAAALALGLASGLGIQMATEVAVEAAGIAVGKVHTAVVEQQELLQRLSLSGEEPSADSLPERLEEYRAEGKRLVFANGAFDGLHSGHIAFLKEARRLGDVLIVGVNSDESLRRLNGQSPRNQEQERLSVVAALESVDHAVLFDEPEPSELIREIRPHVHVKGGDYQEDELLEAAAVREVGGEVVILPLVEPRSTRLLRGKVARRARAA